MTDAIIVALINGAALVVTGVLVVYAKHKLETKLDGIHKQINSRMDEMLKARQELGQQEGKAQEIEDSKNRDELKNK